MTLKPLLSIFCICIWLGVLSKEPFRYGISGGLNISRWDLASSEPKTGFHSGFKMEIPAESIIRNTFIETGGLYSLMGGKLDLLSTVGRYDFRFEYIEFPIRVGYHYPVSKHFSLTGKAGTYISIALSSKETEDKNSVSLTKNEKGEWIKENAIVSTTYDLFNLGFRRIDAGFGLLFGMDFRKTWQFTFGKEWGFFPAVNDEFRINNPGKKKNTNLIFSVSYLINRHE